MELGARELKKYEIRWVYLVILYKGYYLLWSTLPKAGKESREQLRAAVEKMTQKLARAEADSAVLKASAFEDFVGMAVPILHKLYEEMVNEPHRFGADLRLYEEFMVCLGCGVLVLSDGPGPR